MAEARKHSAVDEIDVAVAEAIQACGGDAREAVAALIRTQWAMDRERQAMVSAGYVRRRPGA